MISLVIALHNEQKRFPPRFQEIREYLEKTFPDWELILVDDGSKDDTFSMIKTFGNQDKRIRCLRLQQNLGQGAAVKMGVTMSRGDIVAYMDGDLAVPLSQLNSLVGRLQQGADIAVASRWMPGADITTPQPALRTALGRVYYAIIHRLFIKGVHDTNCGMKAYKKPVVQLIFGLSRCWRWAFNVETLWLAKRYGYNIVEVPTRWEHQKGSKVHVFRDVLFTLWELGTLQLRCLRGIYPDIRIP